MFCFVCLFEFSFLHILIAQNMVVTSDNLDFRELSIFNCNIVIFKLFCLCKILISLIF